MCDIIAISEIWNHNVGNYSGVAPSLGDLFEAPLEGLLILFGGYWGPTSSYDAKQIRA